MKIGFISSTFRRHSCGWLSRWFINALAVKHEVVCYAIGAHYGDELTPSFPNLVDLSNQHVPAIAPQILSDELDVLINIDGITSGLSIELELFFKKVCANRPYILDWLGSDASPFADGFLCDKHTIAPELRSIYSPQLIEMPHCYLAIGGFGVGTPTIRRDDYDVRPDECVFLVNARPRKIGSQDWMRSVVRIVQDVPRSHLWIKNFNRSIQSEWWAVAKELNFAGNLTFIQPDISEETARANLQCVDILLDTYPYNGTTSTLEAFWAHVPVVSVRGTHFSARQGHTLLNAVNLPYLCADSLDGFEAIAVNLGRNRAARELCSRRLEQAKRYSPLYRPDWFTDEFEKVMSEVLRRDRLCKV